MPRRRIRAEPAAARYGPACPTRTPLLDATDADWRLPFAMPFHIDRGAKDQYRIYSAPATSLEGRRPESGLCAAPREKSGEDFLPARRCCRGFAGILHAPSRAGT